MPRPGLRGRVDRGIDVSVAAAPPRKTAAQRAHYADVLRGVGDFDLVVV